MAQLTSLLDFAIWFVFLFGVCFSGLGFGFPFTFDSAIGIRYGDFQFCFFCILLFWHYYVSIRGQPNTQPKAHHIEWKVAGGMDKTCSPSTLSLSCSPDYFLDCPSSPLKSTHDFQDEQHGFCFSSSWGVLVNNSLLLRQRQAQPPTLGQPDRSCPAFRPHHIEWKVAGGMDKT